MGNYIELIDNLSIVEIFKELYPESEIEEEVNPHTKTKLYKTYSVFTNNYSKLPQLYFNERGMSGPDYFCFDSGQRGQVTNLLRYKFDEKHLNFPKKTLDFLFKKLNLKLKIGEIKSFVNEFLELNSRSFHDLDIWEKSLLANNPIILNDGSWVNNYTDKWEGWSKDWEDD